MDLIGGLAAVNAALEAFKTIRSIDKDFDASGVKLALSEMQSNLADAKLALVDAQQERQSLFAEIAKLKENWTFGGALIEYRGYKYYPRPNGEPMGDPFCQVCERRDGSYFQLTRSKGFMEHSCPNCKATYHHLTSFMWDDEG
jgi:hypothetical protein